MKVIQIRGSNGAGKTTIVRQFVQRNNLEIKKISIKGKETFISTNKNGSIVALGRYDKKTGGCDLYTDTDHVINTIMWVIVNLKPKIIVFEGMIYSLSYSFARKVSDFVKNYNYQYLAISLYTNPEVVLERIYKRNGGRAIKENLILDKDKLIICQSNAKNEELKELFPKAIINPLGEWTGGTDVDTGATNRKLGSDMADSVTGGGLHGKDLSKADVSVNIYAFKKAQETGEPVELCCAIGDEEIDGKPYSEIVEIAREYIQKQGGFEKFAEWGLF